VRCSNTLYTLYWVCLAGTNTGRALRYLSESSLASSSNRPNAGDYVILITDGASQDDVITPATTLKSKATVCTEILG